MHRRALLAPTRSSEPSQQRPRRRQRRPARLHRFLCNPTWRIRQSTMTRAWHYSMPRARNLDHPTSVMRVPPARCVKAFEPAWPRARSAHLLAKASSPRLSRACSSPPSGMRDRRMQGRRVRDGFRLACAFTRLRVATRLVSISRDYLPALLALCMHRRALSAPTRSSEPSQQRPRRRQRRPARLHRFLCNPTWRIRQSTMTRAWHYSMPRARNLDHPTSVMRVPPARCVKAFEPAWPRARSA